MSSLGRLLRLLERFKGWLGFCVLLSFLAVGSSVGLMAMSAYLISRTALVSDITEVALVITSVRVFAILRAVFRYLERYYTHTATFRILSHLREWLYASIEPLAPACLGHFHSGDLLARIVSDIETLENFYARSVVPPLAALLVTALACAFLGIFDVRMAWALLAFLVLTGGIMPIASRIASQKPAQALVSTRAGLDALLVDEIQGISDLLSFDLEEQYHARILALSHQLNQAQERIAVLRGLSNALAALFTSLAAVTVLIVAIPLVTGGKLDGTYLALLPLAAIASFEAVHPLSQALQHLEESQHASRRLFELIDAQPEVIDPVEISSPPLDNSIQVQNLRFRYAADEPPALDGVTFSVSAGGRVAIVGPSGSGKSTLVSLLLRFWEYNEGSIMVGGRDIRSYKPEDLRRMIGVVPQEVYLFNATLRDNLLLANPEASDQQITSACRQAQLHGFIESLPLGYETLIGENGLLLSGGERQRLAIARALLKNTPILVLDEFAANLDAITANQLLASLETFMQGRTVIQIAHDGRRLEGFQKIITLEDGRLVHRRAEL